MEILAYTNFCPQEILKVWQPISLVHRPRHGVLPNESLWQDSVAGSVNQATGLPDFEDVLRTGAHVGQDFQPACVRTNPEATVAGTSGQSRP